MAASVLLAGCGKKTASFKPSLPSESDSSNLPVAQAAVTAWQQGDQPTAIGKFLETDWNARPLFAPNSALSLTEEEFKSISKTDQSAKVKEATSQLSTLKHLAAAVTKAGREMAAKGEVTQARKYFISLKQCGTALDNPGCLSLVQLVGKAFKKSADAELAKLGP